MKSGEELRRNICQVMFYLEGTSERRLTATALVRSASTHAALHKLGTDEVFGGNGSLVKRFNAARETLRSLNGSHLAVNEAADWKLTIAGRVFARQQAVSESLKQVANLVELELISTQVAMRPATSSDQSQPQAQAS